MACSDSSTDVGHAQMCGLTISDADPDAPDAKRAKREQLDSQVPSYGESVRITFHALQNAAWQQSLIEHESVTFAIDISDVGARHANFCSVCLLICFIHV